MAELTPIYEGYFIVIYTTIRHTDNDSGWTLKNMGKFVIWNHRKSVCIFMRYTSSEPSLLRIKMLVPLKEDQNAPNLQSGNYTFWCPAGCQLQMLSHSVSWISRGHAVRPQFCVNQYPIAENLTSRPLHLIGAIKRGYEHGNCHQTEALSNE